MPNLSFAQAGALFNLISNELTGGVSPLNQQLSLKQIALVQSSLQNLVDTGAFTDGATITHVQNIADQMNFLTKVVGTTFGTNMNAPPKYINDVIRDVQDIVAGDDNLAALVADNHGFQQVSNLLTPPTPFPDTPFQTQTLLKFIADSNDLAERAMAVVNDGAMDPNLIQDIQAFSTAADAYSNAQGGVFSARFNNEFTLNGVQGTASRELVTGLMNNDANLVNGAAEVLIGNAADVRTNMLVTDQTPTPPNPPPAADSIHNAGLFFDDAATKLIGGVYDGNQASIVSDLQNAAAGVQAGIAAEGLTGKALRHANTVINLLNHEAGLVGGIDTANPTPVAIVNSQIGFDQARILNIVNNDATLANLADGSFIPNPPVNFGFGPDDNGRGHGHMAAVPAIPATPATPAVPGVAPAIPATPATPAIPAMDASMDANGFDFSHLWHHA